MDSPKNKNVLLTGDTGFLENHLADCLSDKGYLVFYL